MRVTVKVEGVREGYQAWAMCIDQQTEDKVPFSDGNKDQLIGDHTGGIATVNVLEGADLIVYEHKDEKAAEQENYLRTGA